MKNNPIYKMAIILLLCILQTAVNGQGREVTGTVLDTEGNPMPGVSIMVKGSSQGAITGIDGNFALNVPNDSAVLVFNFIGYVSSELAVGGQSVIEIVLKEDVMQLDEIVVTGYGTSKKSDLTGSLTSLKEDDFNKGSVTTPEQMMQGRIAGVQITSNNGEPGSGSQIRVRGLSTFRSGSQPLYVVDGIPLDFASSSPKGANGSALNGAPATNPLNFINPGDIQSIDILKDASAAAIYGSRGANGVIIITTKKGKEGKGEVEYSNFVSMSKLPKKLDVLSADEWVSYLDSLKLTKNDFGARTDWQDEIFRTAISHNHNLSLSGGNAKTSYRTSFNYYDQEGIIKKSGMKRYSGRVNVTQKALNDKLLFEVNLTGSQVHEDRVPVGATGYEGDLLLNTLKANPTWPVYNPDGTPYQRTAANERNPVAMLEYTDDRTNTTRVMGNLAATLEIIKGLNYKINLGMDYTNANRLINQSQRLNYMKSTKGSGQINNKELSNYIIEHTLNYSKTFGMHSIGLLAGYSYQEFIERGSETTGGGYTTDGVLYTNNIGKGVSTYSSISSYANPNIKLQSYFGRLNYNLLEKYLITATFRADGSSKFGKNNKYGYFPSFAGAWRLSQENFISDLNIFSNLKLRAGWGETGNSEIDTKNSEPIFALDDASKAIINGTPVGGFKLSRTANPDVTWETTSSINIGADFGIFKGRLSGSVDWYKKTTKNILLPLPTTPLSPSDFVTMNIPDCQIINKGTEISLAGVPVDNGRFSWNINLNGTFANNVVKDLPVLKYATGNVKGQGMTGQRVQVITSDQPMNVFYALEVDSLDAKNKIVYTKGSSGKDTSLYFGDPQPKFTWSISNSFTFKNFDFNFFFEGVHGNKIFNNTALLLDKSNFNQSQNALADFVHDDVAFNNTVRVSNRYIEDGSYVRLSNATLGYTLNLKNIKWISRFRIYVSGSNLWIHTNYTGFDPDVNSSSDENNIKSVGLDITNYPKARTYLAGLSVIF
jgi:TonB-linked SusC/RagA family outer membrane protein